MRSFCDAERRLIECAADFPQREAEMQELLSCVDINACDVDENDLEKTLLSESIKAYRGEKLPELIGWFLNHGHDLKREGGIIGAAALSAVADTCVNLETLDAVKMLLDAGADAGLKLNNEIILQKFGLRSNLAYFMEDDLTAMSLWSMLCEILQAALDGEDYECFYAMDAVVGKRVESIFSDEPLGMYLLLEADGQQLEAGELILNCEGTWLFVNSAAGACVCPEKEATRRKDLRKLDLFGYPQKPMVIEEIYCIPAQSGWERSKLCIKVKDGGAIHICQL